MMMPLGTRAPYTGISKFQSQLCFQVQLPANEHPVRQQRMVQVLGPPPYMGNPDWVLGSWFCPGPASAVVDIWKWTSGWENSLSLSRSNKWKLNKKKVLVKKDVKMDPLSHGFSLECSLRMKCSFLRNGSSKGSFKLLLFLWSPVNVSILSSPVNVSITQHLLFSDITEQLFFS